MNPFANISRRHWLRFFRAGTAVSAAMLVLTAVSMAGGFDRQAFAAPVLRGAVTFSDPATGAITGGGSAPFLITLPQGSACQGSGANGYRWETFLVSSSVNVGSLTFTSGPAPVSGAFVSPLFDSFSEQISTKFPSTTPVGLISGIPLLSLDLQGIAPPVGTYNIGIACTFNSLTEDYWTSQITITADAGDTPLGIAWAVSAATTPTTTTTTAGTTTTTGATTTTRPATTTTTPGASTTTTPGSTTTAAVAVTSSTVRISSAAASQPSGGASGGTSGGAIPVAGSSPLPLVVWALLFLVFGRMTILLARPLRVLPPTTR